MSMYRKDTLDMYRKGLDAGGTALYEMRKAEIAGLGSRRGNIGKRINSNIAETPARMFKEFEDINNIASERRLRQKPDEDGFIDVSPRAEAGDQGDPDFVIPSYPKDLTKSKIEVIIKQEAKLRKMDPNVAVRLFRSEGATAYQSKIKSGTQKKEGGQEASFGPFQLYTGGGLGNQYEEQTGRVLSEDNTAEGITKQIQFALDMAIDKGWSPWYGSKAAGIGPREGLDNAVPVYNWRVENEDI
jgi:hypothetical protein